MSDDVQRYSMQDASRGYDAWQELKRAPDGDWVSHDDYARLKAERDRLVAKVIEFDRCERLAPDGVDLFDYLCDLQAKEGK